MQSLILVADGDKKQCFELCNLLKKQNYEVACSHSVANLERLVEQTSFRVMLLDLDTVPVDNRAIRRLKRVNPAMKIIAVSRRPFHPELREAMTACIYACLSKPVDPDELIYWIKSVFYNASTFGDHPPHDEWKPLH